MLLVILQDASDEGILVLIVEDLCASLSLDAWKIWLRVWSQQISFVLQLLRG